MPRTLGRLWVLLALVATLVGTAATPVVAAAPGVQSAIVGTPIRSVYVRPPQGGTIPGKPVQVLVALHGMGGNGEAFSRDLIEQADHYGWMIMAPTVEYGDWTKPEVVAREDPIVIHALADFIDQLPQATGVPVRRLVLVLGHSRGA